MESPKEKCAVFGVCAPKEEVARLTYFALFALQHRGQEASGIAVSNGENVFFHKDQGLVAQVFNEHIISELKGHIAIGHNRYGTCNGGGKENAQPFVIDDMLAFAHNGNLPSTRTLVDFLSARGIATEHCSDSALMAKAIASYMREGMKIEDAIQAAYPLFTGAFSFVAMTKDTLIGARDEKGVRPLCVGKTESGYVISSETCALSTIGATFIREVLPGEMVVVKEHEMKSIQIVSGTQKLDIFEFIYFARHDSILLGQSVYQVRKNFGTILAREFPVEADVVVGVPETALPAALGYAQALNIPYEQGINKNRYIQRTFIQPEQKLRDKSVQMKLSPILSVIRDKRVVVIDDSIVRGTTSKPIVEMLCNAGAREVHFLVSSPPIKYPDFYGIDTPTQDKLIAFEKSVEEIREYLGATSLHFLSLEGVVEATGLPKTMLNTSCFTGEYPIDLGERYSEFSKANV